MTGDPFFSMLRSAVSHDTFTEKRSAGMMTLSEIVHALPLDDRPVMLEDGTTVSNTVSSYRGYYEHLAIDPEGECTSTQLRRTLERAWGHTFEGYKGGLFTMHRDTLVFVSRYGDSSGIGIIGVDLQDFCVVLKTLNVEADA